MHFPLIQLSDEIIKEDDMLSSSDIMYDDPVVSAETDYVGDEYDEQERKSFIKNRIPSIFGNYCAIIDLDTEFLVVEDKDSLDYALKEYLDNSIETVKDSVEKYNVSHALWLMEYLSKYPYMQECLVNYNGYTYTIGSFIQDLRYFAGKRLYIGSIIDCHV